MEKKLEMFSYPQNDKTKRLIIGKGGNNNILVIGLNPSTADTIKHDPTTRNIEKIAKQNGYDGWFLVNLYPKRATNPKELIIEQENNSISENAEFISAFLYFNKYKIKDIWLAWGDNIEKNNSELLKKSAYYIYKRLEKFDLKYLTIGLTNKKNPMHPSPQVTNTNPKFKNKENIELFDFNFSSYAKNIKSNINLGPDIKY